MGRSSLSCDIDLSRIVDRVHCHIDDTTIKQCTCGVGHCVGDLCCPIEVIRWNKSDHSAQYRDCALQCRYRRGDRRRLAIDFGDQARHVDVNSVVLISSGCAIRYNRCIVLRRD